MKWKNGTTRVEKTEKWKAFEFHRIQFENPVMKKNDIDEWNCGRKAYECKRKGQLHTNSHTNTLSQIEKTTVTVFLFYHSKFTSPLAPAANKKKDPVRWALVIFFNVQPLLSRTFVIFLIMSLHKNISTGPKIIHRKWRSARRRRMWRRK